MKEFIEKLKQNQKTQKGIETNVINFSNPLYRTQHQIGQKAIFQKSNYEQAMETMVKTIEDTDIELEPKGNKPNFLASKRRISDKQYIQEKEQVNRTELLVPPKKTIRMFDRIETKKETFEDYITFDTR